MNDQTFTERIAAQILSSGVSTHHLTVIVPSERMIGYLQRAFFTVDGKPKIAPQIITIDRWIQQYTTHVIPNKTRLLFRLYDIFRQDPADHHEVSFDRFLTWGQLLLSDFDETDRYLVDAKDLFKNLRDVHEIESWSFNSTELSEGQLKFIAFWEKLGPYYFELQTQLQKAGENTRGKLYRDIAQDIQQVFKTDKEAHFVFAGFNAMSAAELSIVRQLYNLGRAQVFLDTDSYYLRDANHEAGTFHRAILQHLGLKTLPFELNSIATKSLQTVIIECPFSSAQASAIGTILADMTESELQETLVLLADEDLITPLLQHLPRSISKANITLGLPLKNTSLRLWVDLIFSLQENFARGNKAVYFKDARRFFQHPFIYSILSREERREVEAFDRSITRHNRIFINVSSLPVSERTQQIIECVFQPWENDWKKALKLFQQTSMLLDDKLPADNIVERAIVRTFHHALIDLTNLADSVDLPEMNIQTFRTLFNQVWRTENIAYFGNPLNGVQIMGLLETRGIDFKKVLVLGLNEGKMPPGNPVQTLIPMDLRRFYGLPTPREKQGLFAHHFYRLLHRAEQLYITYASTTENIGSSEPSRYVRQIELELSRLNPKVTIEHRVFNVGPGNTSATEKIEKTPGLLTRLDAFLAEGVSASALKTYVLCPMDFYYKYLLRLSEEDEVEESIQSNTYGTILHKVMENLFREACDRQIPIFPEFYDAAIDKLPLEIDKAFRSEFSEDVASYATGITQLNFQMAGVLLKRMLLREKQMVTEAGTALRVLALEQKIDVHTTITVNGEEKPIRITGTLDRVDQLNGKVRILDYKSGGCQDKDVKVKGKPGKHGIQLLNYAYLYHQHYQKDADIIGILSFRNTSNSPFILDTGKSTAENPAIFEEILQEIIEEMYSDKPFEHSSSTYCSYCSAFD